MITQTLPEIEFEFFRDVHDRCEGSSERGGIGISEDGRYWGASAWFRDDEFEDWAVEPYEITKEEYEESAKNL